MKQPDELKRIALDFLSLCVQGRPAEAFRGYAAEGFVHHNAFYRSDAASLIRGMEESAEAHPFTKLEPKHVVREGGLVAVHSHITMKPGHPGYAVMHILRFEGGKIAELWDFAQEVPDGMVNERGMF